MILHFGFGCPDWPPAGGSRNSPFNDSWQCSMKMNPDIVQRTRRFCHQEGCLALQWGNATRESFSGLTTTNTHPLGKRGRKKALHAPAPGYDGMQAAIVPASLDRPVIGQRGGWGSATGKKHSILPVHTGHGNVERHLERTIQPDASGLGWFSQWFAESPFIISSLPPHNLVSDSTNAPCVSDPPPQPLW